MTTMAKSFMRKIDRVAVKGSRKPVDLYTCDLDESGLVLDV